VLPAFLGGQKLGLDSNDGDMVVFPNSKLRTNLVEAVHVRSGRMPVGVHGSDCHKEGMLHALLLYQLAHFQ
jgi:hypothetical protein